MMEIEQIKSLLKGRLTEYRYNHSLNVADEAVRLAEKYGADKEKAYLAGLVHDAMKDVAKDDALKYISDNGIVMTDLEMNAPKLWHAILGAHYIRQTIGIDDSDIINAVRYHTTARSGMSLLEKVIYLADYTSAERDYDGVDQMRKAVDTDLKTAMYIALDFTVNDLKSKNVPVHPDTLAAFDEIT